MSRLEPIRITSKSIDESRPLPREVEPRRASLTVNCLIPIKRTGSFRLVCHNFDPNNWNQWYPPFTFYHCNLPAGLKTESELVQYFEKESAVADRIGQPANLMRDLAEHVRSVLNLASAQIGREEFRAPHYWLKFSKSKGVWTLYCFAWFVLRSAKPGSRLAAEQPGVLAAVPLGATEYDGIALVENVKELWEDPEVLADLRAKAISVRA